MEPANRAITVLGSGRTREGRETSRPPRPNGVPMVEQRACHKATRIPDKRVSFLQLSATTIDPSSPVNRFLALVLFAAAGGSLPVAAQQTDPSRLTTATDLRLRRVRRPAVRPLPLARGRFGLHHRGASRRGGRPGHRPVRCGRGQPGGPGRGKPAGAPGRERAARHRGLRRGRPTGRSCWSSPTPSRSGDSTPEATTGSSTGPAARSRSWAGPRRSRRH